MTISYQQILRSNEYIQNTNNNRILKISQSIIKQSRKQTSIEELSKFDIQGFDILHQLFLENNQLRRKSINKNYNRVVLIICINFYCHIQAQIMIRDLQIIELKSQTKGSKKQKCNELNNLLIQGGQEAQEELKRSKEL
ncbi:unnamed protein product [Paramecium pentaurelia]|uniref:Uncharacterized protein n=1 Tax=Paramecium pentaurelia TaxID=43138 RepID=A0A8S1YHG6_9CILI|nr:unnamed protein product [Paramecium pentaurelia]CAD8213515.1 unnamed protein product [Paramecium pentaurelia]